MAKIKCPSFKKTVAMICPMCQSNMTPVNKNIGTCPKCHHTGVGVCPICRSQVTSGYCWIATAAYGSPMASELDVLRAFRDTRLETDPIGRGLVELYYRTAPPIADAISLSEKARALTRKGLNPIVRALKKRGY